MWISNRKAGVVGSRDTDRAGVGARSIYIQYEHTDYGVFSVRRSYPGG